MDIAERPRLIAEKDVKLALVSVLAAQRQQPELQRQQPELQQPPPKLQRLAVPQLIHCRQMNSVERLQRPHAQMDVALNTVGAVQPQIIAELDARPVLASATVAPQPPQPPPRPARSPRPPKWCTHAHSPKAFP